MKRVLCLISGMNAGGAETFLMKLYRQLDKTKYQMDFCINVFDKCFYEEEILALGGKYTEFRRSPYREVHSKSNFMISLKQITTIMS